MLFFLPVIAYAFLAFSSSGSEARLQHGTNKNKNDRRNLQAESKTFQAPGSDFPILFYPDGSEQLEIQTTMVSQSSVCSENPRPALNAIDGLTTTYAETCDSGHGKHSWWRINFNGDNGVRVDTVVIHTVAGQVDTFNGVRLDLHQDNGEDIRQNIQGLAGTEQTIIVNYESGGAEGVFRLDLGRWAGPNLYIQDVTVFGALPIPYGAVENLALSPKTGSPQWKNMCNEGLASYATDNTKTGPYAEGCGYYNWWKFEFDFTARVDFIVITPVSGEVESLDYTNVKLKAGSTLLAVHKIVGVTGSEEEFVIDFGGSSVQGVTSVVIERMYKGFSIEKMLLQEVEIFGAKLIE